MKEHFVYKVSASSHVTDMWLTIDWRHVEQIVRGMQVSIAKVTLSASPAYLGKFSQA